MSPKQTALGWPWRCAAPGEGESSCLQWSGGGGSAALSLWKPSACGPKTPEISKASGRKETDKGISTCNIPGHTRSLPLFHGTIATLYGHIHTFMSLYRSIHMHMCADFLNIFTCVFNAFKVTTSNWTVHLKKARDVPHLSLTALIWSALNVRCQQLPYLGEC